MSPHQMCLGFIHLWHFASRSRVFTLPDSLPNSSAARTNILLFSHASIAPDIALHPTLALTHTYFPPLVRRMAELTSQISALLQMVDTFPPVALAHLLPYQPRHHALYPLLAYYCILGCFERLIVIVVYAIEGWRYCRLRCFEGL